MKEAQRHFRRTHLGLRHLPFAVFVQSHSIGNACSVPVPPTGAESSPSEESEAEWKEVATSPWARHMPSVAEKSVGWMGRAGRALGA